MRGLYRCFSICEMGSEQEREWNAEIVIGCLSDISDEVTLNGDSIQRVQPQIKVMSSRGLPQLKKNERLWHIKAG